MTKARSCVAAAVLLLFSCSDSGEMGRSYASLDEVKKDQESRGYVFLGRFGDVWPATVTEVKKEMNEISFERMNGARHQYPGFDGYELKVLRLSAGGEAENVVVLRSKEKRSVQESSEKQLTQKPSEKQPMQESLEKPSRQTVADPLREKVSKAKIQYQNALYDIFVSEAPAFEEVFQINRDLQILSTRRSDMRFYHLLKHAPDRIQTGKGYMEWLNFEWTEQDESELMAASTDYVNLQERLSALKEKNQGHPMWPEARKLFRQMQKDPRMIDIHKQLQGSLDEISEALKK